MTNAPPPPAWDTQSSGQVAYGGFWLRVVAYIIDAILLNIAAFIIGLIAGQNLFSARDAAHFNPGLNLAFLAVGWLYFALMESSERGATVGKMALGLRVVTDDGQRLSFARATGRYFAKIVSALILGIGFIMVAFTDRKRGLHDMIASTLVIKAA